MSIVDFDMKMAFTYFHVLFIIYVDTKQRNDVRCIYYDFLNLKMSLLKMMEYLKQSATSEGGSNDRKCVERTKKESYSSVKHNVDLFTQIHS